MVAFVIIGSSSCETNDSISINCMRRRNSSLVSATLCVMHALLKFFTEIWPFYRMSMLRS